MKKENNIFDRLRAGVSIETITGAEAEIINDLNASGNERIVLSSDDSVTSEQIEAAIPFSFEVIIDDGLAAVNVYLDGSPDGKNPAFHSGFALTADVILKWI